jgi:hypothetical protein
VDGEAANARFSYPAWIAVDAAGNLYVVDGYRINVRKVTPAGLVSTLATSVLWMPTGIAVDGQGNVYVADYRAIWKFPPDGAVQLFVGGGANGSADGTGSLARVDAPSGIALDASGSLWVADTGNHTIRKVTPSRVVSTVGGRPGFSGSQDGTGPTALFDEPWGIAVDTSGSVFVTDRASACVRKGIAAQALQDMATIDSPFGLVGETRRLDTTARTATTWLWEVVRRPPGSVAPLDGADRRDASFTPDVPDLYVFRLTASDGAGASSTSTVSLTVRAAGPPDGPPVASLLPIVLDVATPSAQYTTELALTNGAGTLLPFSVLYTASLGARLGSGTVSGYLRPGEQKRIGDVLDWLRDQGLALPPAAEDGQQGGTLLVRFDGDGSLNPKLVSATARTAALTTAPQPVGRAGLAYPGLSAGELSTSSVVLYGLRSSSSDRTNLAVFNTSPDPVSVKVTACSGSGDGRCAVVRSAESLPPWGWTQFGSAELLDANGIATGWAVVERTSATGSFGAYAVINDNVTNDGSFVLPAGRAGAGSRMTVPVLVETPYFRSELILANRSATPVTLDLNYVESLTPWDGKGGTVTVVLGAREQRILPEAIDFFRRSGVGIGPAGTPYRRAEYAGSLRITVSGATTKDVFAGARTSARSPASTGGQFGLFTPCVYGGEEASDVAFLYGLRRDPQNRTNVAVVNAGSDADGPVSLLLEVFDGDNEGRPRGLRSFGSSLAPGQWKQLDPVRPEDPSTMTALFNGWVKVTRTSGTAPWIAYAVINDGGSPGERTGDGAYVPMVK